MIMKIFTVKSVVSNNLLCSENSENFKEKNDEKYLILDSTDKYEGVWYGIRSKIKALNGGKELFYEKNYAKIGVNNDDEVPLNKPIKFPKLTIIIRCVFQ